MPSYSSDQFRRDWRYGLKSDFKNANGEDYPYIVPHGHIEWGSEKHHVKFRSEQLGPLAISGDHKLAAVAVDHDIHILDTTSWQVVQVVQGHPSYVGAISFHPTDSNILLACSDRDYAQTPESKSIIALWDLRNTAKRNVPASLVESVTRKLAQNAIQSISRTLSDHDIGFDIPSLSPDEEARLAPDFRKQIKELLVDRNLPTARTMEGQLYSGRDSSAFSPSGHFFTYHAGRSPPSNGKDDRWQVNIYSLEMENDAAVLYGHTDSIMRAIFDKSERYIATVSWDKTMKIWDWDGKAKDGQRLAPKYEFKTDGQNWTGEFSPCSKYFAGTVGSGKVHVYSLEDGGTHISYDLKQGWYRTLAWVPNMEDLDARWRLAVGGRYGKILLFDLDGQEALQERTLTSENSKTDDEVKSLIQGYVETSQLFTVDNGWRLVSRTQGDGGIEIYDLMRQMKWRIARGGVDLDLPKAKDGVLNTAYDGRCRVWRVAEITQLCVVALYEDGLRVWYLET